MGWNLNLEHGYYRARLSIKAGQIEKRFGVKDGDKRIELGKIKLNIPELDKTGIIAREGHDEYRILIWGGLTR